MKSMVNIRLLTDYHDYYDHYFDLDGLPYQRFTKTSRTRQNDFVFLQNAGFCVPWFGKVEHCQRLCSALQVKVVIYDKPTAHCGDGKRLISSIDLAKEDPDKFCSFYIPASKAYHIRLLAIGEWKAVLRYTSNHEWLSNNGDVEIELLQYGEFREPKIEKIQRWLREPLLAIDGRYSDQGEFVTFDLNTAPGIKGTGIEKILEPQIVVQYIKDFFLQIKAIVKQVPICPGQLAENQEKAAMFDALLLASVCCGEYGQELPRLQLHIALST